MNTRIGATVTGIAVAALGGLMIAAPAANAATLAAGPTTSVVAAGAGTDPLVPYGTDPHTGVRLGYVNPNHDEGVFTNGQTDVPF